MVNVVVEMEHGYRIFSVLFVHYISVCKFLVHNSSTKDENVLKCN